MAFYTVNSGAPESTAFTLASRTLVQTSVLGSSSSEKVDLQVRVSTGPDVYENYGIELDSSKPEDYNLAPNTYRLKLRNPEKVSGDVVVSVSPNS